MNERSGFEARLEKRAHVKNCEELGLVADTLDVRRALMEQVRAGEKTLVQAQAELKQIQAQAKKNGMLTREQAFSRG